LANVNRLQANSLDASQQSADAQLEALDKRTGGLNSSATAYGMKDLAGQKMRLADQLSSERAANDYRSNVGYQQQLLSDEFEPAQLEGGYYGTAMGGQDAALGDLTQFGLASYGPWMSAISAAGAAGAGAAQHCWIAMAIYGDTDWRTLLLRSWLGDEFRRTWLGERIMRLYERYGERIAVYVRRWTWLRWSLRPLFELALARAIRERVVDVDAIRVAGV